MTAEEQEDRLVLLEEIARQRLLKIEESRRDREEEEARHTNRLREIADDHMKANRVLVEAAEAAQHLGIRKTDICARIGLTNQRLRQMKLALVARDQRSRAA